MCSDRCGRTKRAHAGLSTGYDREGAVSDWRPNPGRLPDGAKGKRIAVRLANGSAPDPAPISNAVPPGWAADTTRWSITGAPHDVREYRIL